MQLARLESVNRFLSKSAMALTSGGALATLLFMASMSAASAGTLYIGGSPTTAVAAPTQYHFTPWIRGSDTSTAKFAIKNKPAWASFNTSTGELYGRVSVSNVGKYTNIIISAKGASSSASMPAFSIAISNGSTTAGGPTISGSPAASQISVGSAFSFKPTASDPAGRTLTFSVNTKPSWAKFDTTTGRLYGTPGSTNTGTTSNIVITASDGVASASLHAFSLTVVEVANGSATLSWMPPTTDTTGAVLQGLAGYQIRYGTSSNNLSQTIQLANAGLTRYVVTDLAPGTYYFGVAAYTSGGTQSKLSPLVSKTVLN